MLMSRIRQKHEGLVQYVWIHQEEGKKPLEFTNLSHTLYPWTDTNGQTMLILHEWAICKENQLTPLWPWDSCHEAKSSNPLVGCCLSLPPLPYHLLEYNEDLISWSYSTILHFQWHQSLSTTRRSDGDTGHLTRDAPILGELLLRRWYWRIIGSWSDRRLLVKAILQSWHEILVDGAKNMGCSTPFPWWIVGYSTLYTNQHSQEYYNMHDKCWDCRGLTWESGKSLLPMKTGIDRPTFLTCLMRFSLPVFNPHTYCLLFELPRWW